MLRTKYFSALKIYSRCLKAETPADTPQLESCLYEGEHTAVKTLQWLDYQIDYGDLPKDAIYQMFASCDEMGIRSIYYISGSLYGHDFFRKLKELFPDSKHKAEVEYRIISAEVWMLNQKGRCGWWKPWKNALEVYLERFPQGKYSTLARLDLARIHDDLWEFRDPDADTGYKECFTTGSRKKDIALSRFHRKKAMQLYREVLNSPYRKSVGEWLVQVKRRIEGLKKGVGDGFVWVVSD